VSSCEIGILVVAYLVLISAVVDFVVQRRITKRLDRIEELLASAAEKSLDNSDKVADSKSK
jgi:HAMP domain-containing protein